MNVGQNLKPFYQLTPDDESPDRETTFQSRDNTPPINHVHVTEFVYCVLRALPRFQHGPRHEKKKKKKKKTLLCPTFSSNHHRKQTPKLRHQQQNIRPRLRHTPPLSSGSIHSRAVAFTEKASLGTELEKGYDTGFVDSQEDDETAHDTAPVTPSVLLADAAVHARVGKANGHRCSSTAHAYPPR